MVLGWDLQPQAALSRISGVAQLTVEYPTFSKTIPALLRPVVTM